MMVAGGGWLGAASIFGDGSATKDGVVLRDALQR